MPLDPLLQRLIRKAYQTGHDRLSRMSTDEVRDYLEKLGSRSQSCDSYETYSPEDPISFFIQRTQHPKLGTLVFIRGSAFTGGSFDDTHTYCKLLSEWFSMDVVTLNFRTAPEHRFPIYFEDVVQNTLWIHQHQSELNLHPRFIVWGESSGGTMAASLCQYLASNGLKIFDTQVLIYPMVDLVRDYPSKKLYGQGYMLDLSFIEWLKDRTLNNPDEANDFRASPGCALKLQNQPNTFIITAEYDPLRDEAEAYANALREAGNCVISHRQLGVIHGFLRYHDKLTGAKETLGWIRERLHTQCS